MNPDMFFTYCMLAICLINSLTMICLWLFVSRLTSIQKQNGFIMDEINYLRNDVEFKASEIGSRFEDIKDRLIFLESSALYTMPLEPAQLNPRSAAAREMWKKRKAKKLEKKE